MTTYIPSRYMPCTLGAISRARLNILVKYVLRKEN